MSRRDADAADLGRLDALTEVSRRRVVVNALSNYSRYGVALLVNLFLQAYIIRTVGAAEYSIWPLATTVASFITLIPLAISGSVNRYLAHAFTRKDLSEVRQITTSVFYATLAGTLVYLAAVVAFSLSFERIFSIPEGAAGIGPWVMLLYGLGESFKTPVAVFQGGLDAAQKFVAINIREILILLLYGILVVLAFTISSPALVWAAGAYAVTQAMGALITWRLARRILPWQRISRGSFDWRILRTVLNFGVWVLVGAVATLLYWRVGNIIINKLLDPVLVTGYSVVVAIMVQGYAIAGYGSGVLHSAAAVLHAKQDFGRLARMVYRASRVTTLVAGPAILFLALFGRPVMTLYLGDPQYGEYGIYFSVLGAAMIIQMTQIPGLTVPRAFAKNAAFNLVAMLSAAVNVGLAVLLITVFDWGLMAVAASAALVITLYNIWFAPWYAGRLLGVSWHEYLAKSMLLPIMHCLPALAVLGVFRVAGYGDTIPQFIAIVATVAVLHLAYMLTVGLMPEDRKAVLKWLGRLARRGRPGRDGGVDHRRLARRERSRNPDARRLGRNVSDSRRIRSDRAEAGKDTRREAEFFGHVAQGHARDPHDAAVRPDQIEPDMGIDDPRVPDEIDTLAPLRTNDGARHRDRTARARTHQRTHRLRPAHRPAVGAAGPCGDANQRHGAAHHPQPRRDLEAAAGAHGNFTHVAKGLYRVDLAHLEAGAEPLVAGDEPRVTHRLVGRAVRRAVAARPVVEALVEWRGRQIEQGEIGGVHHSPRRRAARRAASIGGLTQRG